MDNKFNTNNDEISLLKYINFLKKDKSLIFVLTILFTSLGVVYSILKKPIWSGSFQMVVKSESKPLSSRLSNTSFAPLLNLAQAPANNTKLEILKSPLILTSVYDFVKNNNKNMTLDFNEWRTKNTKISFLPSTEILQVDYLSDNKESILPTLNLIINKYQDYSIDTTKKEISRTIRFLETQERILSKRYKNSLEEFNKFSINNGLGNIDGFIALGDSNTKGSLDNDKENKSSSRRAGQRYSLLFNSLEEKEATFKALSSKLKPNSQILKNLELEINNLKEALKRPNEILVKYRDLETIARRNQNLLNKITNNLEAYKIESVKKLIPWEIISESKLQKLRVYPKRKIIVLRAFFIGLVFSCIISLLKNIKEGKLYEKEDYEKLISTKFIDNLYINDLNINLLVLKKYFPSFNNDSPLTVLFLKNEKGEIKRFLPEKIKINYLKTSNLTEIKKFKSIIVIAKSGEINTKNLKIINKYIKLFESNFLGWFYLNESEDFAK